jgi:tRNA modification GTPase
MKEGVRTVIVGQPNAGKSTLLNTFLQEERAIVSAVAGTTRDVIEETILINGIKFRLMDTAGIRDSADEVEQIGIGRTMSKINEADLIIYLIPYQNFNSDLIEEFILSLPKGKKLIIGVSKVDEINNYFDFNISDNQILNKYPIVYFSSKTGHHIDLLKVDMCNAIGLDYEALKRGHVISHGRHFDALQKAKKSVSAIMETLKMDGVSQDFMLVDIQLTLEYIGLITGQVYPDDILGEIFSKFCIGK